MHILEKTLLLSTTIIGSFYIFGIGIKLLNNNSNKLLNISVVCTSGTAILFIWYKTFTLLKI